MALFYSRDQTQSSTELELLLQKQICSLDKSLSGLIVVWLWSLGEITTGCLQVLFQMYIQIYIWSGISFIKKGLPCQDVI